jgi:site-specific DNA-methyltransferase (adenine-specific)
MKDISANSVDLIICDLPYGCLTNQKGESKGFYRESHEGTDLVKKLSKQTGVGCQWDIKIDLPKFWAEAKRILRNEHSPVIHFCTTKFGFELYKSNPDWFRYDLIWDKGRGVSFLTANKMPMRSHEMIYVFCAKGAFYNRIDIKGDFKATSRTGGCKGAAVYNVSAVYHSKVKHATDTKSDERCALSVIKNPVNAKKGNHPTEKPVELYRWLIERYCPPTGTVLDPTFGSGNSVITAHAMGRHAIGIEKDKDFYDKALAKITPTNEIVNP